VVIISEKGPFIIAIVTACSMNSFASSLQIQVHLDPSVIEMGRSVCLDVFVSDENGVPIPNCLILPYVNERRWGSHEVTNTKGRARIILPLPNVGLQQIVVRGIPDIFDTCWIWTQDAQSKTAHLGNRFTLNTSVSEADIRIAVNGQCKVIINDNLLGEATGVQADTCMVISPELFIIGVNTISIEASNNTSLACLAAQLRMRIEGIDRFITTDRSWISWVQSPSCLSPVPLESDQTSMCSVTPVRILGRLWDDILPNALFETWPGNIHRDDLFAGRLLPQTAIVSKSFQVEVRRRSIPCRRDPNHLIGMQWGSYFFPNGFYWQNTQAVPLTGFYESFHPDVIRQQILWFLDLGIDYLIADWPIHIEPDSHGKQHWSNRNAFGVSQVHVTTLMLEGLAQLRDEGYQVPAMVIMAFLCNGPSNTTETVNEELDWLYESFIRNPRFHDLWVIYDGKPLITLLYTLPTPADQLPGPKINNDRFTIRYVGTQLQDNRMDRYGYWSWMDGSVEPVITCVDGKPEAVTPTPACFTGTGWLGNEAYGRRNGTTFLRSFRPALAQRPQFVTFHQWNEFTGQNEGYPYDNGMYGDSYSVELSDDLEPVSLTMAGYRGDHGGWGYYYANLTQAMVDLFKQPVARDSLLAVYPPLEGATLSGDTLRIGWELIGNPPSSFTVLLDSEKVAGSIQGNEYTLDLKPLDAGRHVISVVAEDATTHYALAIDQLDIRHSEGIPVRADVSFVLNK